MISDNDDLHRTIQYLSDQLRQGGENQRASALANALSISTAPGEILGESRLQLQILRSSRIPLRVGLDRSVHEALAYLDKILGPQI